MASIASCDSEPLPIEAKLYLPGLAFNSAINSATELTLSSLLTASALGCVINCVIAAMSFFAS